MYRYAYRRYKQKHAITKDFDTNKDFVIENEGFASETLPLGASRANKRIRSTVTDRDEVDPTGAITHIDDLEKWIEVKVLSIFFFFFFFVKT